MVLMDVWDDACSPVHRCSVDVWYVGNHGGLHVLTHANTPDVGLQEVTPWSGCLRCLVVCSLPGHTHVHSSPCYRSSMHAGVLVKVHLYSMQGLAVVHCTSPHVVCDGS